MPSFRIHSSNAYDKIFRNVHACGCSTEWQHENKGCRKLKLSHQGKKLHLQDKVFRGDDYYTYDPMWQAGGIHYQRVTRYLISIHTKGRKHETLFKTILDYDSKRGLLEIIYLPNATERLFYLKKHCRDNNFRTIKLCSEKKQEKGTIWNDIIDTLAQKEVYQMLFAPVRSPKDLEDLVKLKWFGRTTAEERERLHNKKLKRERVFHSSSDRPQRRMWRRSSNGAMGYSLRATLWNKLSTVIEEANSKKETSETSMQPQEENSGDHHAHAQSGAETGFFKPQDEIRTKGTEELRMNHSGPLSNSGEIFESHPPEVEEKAARPRKGKLESSTRPEVDRKAKGKGKERASSSSGIGDGIEGPSSIPGHLETDATLMSGGLGDPSERAGNIQESYFPDVPAITVGSDETNASSSKDASKFSKNERASLITECPLGEPMDLSSSDANNSQMNTLNVALTMPGGFAESPVPSSLLSGPSQEASAISPGETFVSVVSKHPISPDDSTSSKPFTAQEDPESIPGESFGSAENHSCPSPCQDQDQEDPPPTGSTGQSGANTHVEIEPQTSTEPEEEMDTPPTSSEENVSAQKKSKFYKLKNNLSRLRNRSSNNQPSQEKSSPTDSTGPLGATDRVGIEQQTSTEPEDEGDTPPTYPDAAEGDVPAQKKSKFYKLKKKLSGITKRSPNGITFERAATRSGSFSAVAGGITAPIGSGEPIVETFERAATISTPVPAGLPNGGSFTIRRETDGIERPGNIFKKAFRKMTG